MPHLENLHNSRNLKSSLGIITGLLLMENSMFLAHGTTNFALETPADKVRVATAICLGALGVTLAAISATTPRHSQ